MNNQVGGLIPEKVGFSYRSSHQLPVALYVGIESHKSSLFLISAPIGAAIVHVLCRQPCSCGIMGEASLPFLGDTISHQTPWSSGLCSLSTPLFCRVPRAFGAGIVWSMYSPGLDTSRSVVLCAVTRCGFLQGPSAPRRSRFDEG